jgi:hypothetical protein
MACVSWYSRGPSGTGSVTLQFSNSRWVSG